MDPRPLTPANLEESSRGSVWKVILAWLAVSIPLLWASGRPSRRPRSCFADADRRPPRAGGKALISLCKRLHFIKLHHYSTPGRSASREFGA
jgi:hypothetical protein